MTDGRFSGGLFQALCPDVPDGGLGAFGCAVAAWEGPIFLALGLALAGGIVFLVRRRAQAQEDEAPLLLFSREEGEEEWTPAASRWAAPAPETTPEAAQEGAPPADPHPTVPRPPAIDGPPPDGPEPEPDDEELAQLAQEEPPEGTLQLLPGSLEIQNGQGAGRQIRFARAPGKAAVITFGRSTGPPYRHVQLPSATVSRLHARLIFRERRWILRNESATNPTMVNGRPLDGRPSETVLEDGDRIEMGDVLFLFHQPGSPDRLALRSSWYTDRGRRPTNQDAVAVRTLPGGRELAVVCDGMGSHASGGVASHIALEALVEALGQGADLVHGVQEANRAIHRAAEGDAEQDGMGTTLVALLREGERYLVANVGDSRAYRVDENGIEQLTLDHSFVTEAVGEGSMSLEEAHQSPWRHALTRNLGAESEVQVDLFGPFDATEPHVAILSTDGVHGVLSDREIEGVVRDASDVQDVARTLAEAALLRGGEDNVAVAAVRFSGPSPGTR